VNVNVTIPTVVTLWYPHANPSRLHHGTQVRYVGIGQSRIYATLYPPPTA